MSIGAEAPEGMKRFNVHCPAKAIAPALDHAYHECNNGMLRRGYDACGEFMNSFKKLLPDYDCQRPFDATSSKNYIVPAIWMVGDGELEDYLKLLARMALGKDRMFSQPEYMETVKTARELFISQEFRAVLDGESGEIYGPLSDQVEAKMKKAKNHHIPVFKGAR